MNIDNTNDFDDLEDDFYIIRVKSYEIRPKIWMVRGIVVRKDTGETVGGTQIRTDDINQALRKLKKSLKPMVAALARPPLEWGGTSIRQILMTYMSFNDEVTSAYVSLEKKLALGKLTKDELHKYHYAIYEMVSRQTIQLIGKLEMLTEVEKQKIVTSPEEVYRQIQDPYNLDDVYARDEIFKFILHPSTEIIKRHETHRARMISEFTNKSK